MFDEVLTDPQFANVSPAAVYRKVQWNTLPLLCLVAAFCYLDRTNLAFASIQLNRELQFTPAVYGFGSGLFFLGYSVFMIPSNIIMLKVGAPRWLGVMVAAWGLVAMAFIGLSSPQHFYWLRFLLGVAEAGAFPAMWYYLYTLLPPDQLTIPLSVLEVAVSSANVVSAPLAAGLLQLGGRGGMAGWQWLFLVEGCATVVIGIAVVVLLPPHVLAARFLTSAERRWLAHRLDMLAQMPQPGRSGQRGSGLDHPDGPLQAGYAAAGVTGGSNSIAAALKEAVSNTRVWYVSVMGFLKNIASHGILFWCPIIVAALMQHQDMEPLQLDWASHRSGGATPVGAAVVVEQLAVTPQGGRDMSNAAVLLTGVPFACAAVFAIWLGRRSQAKGEKALHLAAPYLTSALLFASFPRVAGASSMAAFGSVAGLVACIQGSNSIINSYITVLAGGTAVSLAMALYNAVANLGGLVGPWLIGEVVYRTGTYGDAFRLLGVVMGAAAIMAWHTRTWPRIGDHAHVHEDLMDDSVSKMLEESEF